MKNKETELSIILPCRNEEKALPFCLSQIKKIIKKHKINAEIIVSDSSEDKSPIIAKKNKVRLVKHDKIGYGNAYLEAFKQVKSPYIFMADCDGTYDFSYIPLFLKELKKGNDLVIGNRFSGKMEKNSMPLSHKYIGNPILSATLRLFFRTKIKDSHSGMRAIKKEALDKLNLQTTGMEFASEMIIKAINHQLKIKEIPISYQKRIGDSKLKSFVDAWRHMRFMLLYSPLFLFFIPGLFLFLIGIESLIWFYFKDPVLFGIPLYDHPMFLSSIFTIIGYQLIIFSVFAKTYAITHLREDNIYFDRIFRYITIETASIFGIFISLVGIIIFALIFYMWVNSGFQSLTQVRNSILALTLTTIGIQTIFSSFMLSILGIKEK